MRSHRLGTPATLPDGTHTMASSKDELKSGGRDDRLSGPKRVRHREEEHIRKAMLAEARDACPEARAAYVECAKGRTITVAWYCKGLFREFNECLKHHTSDEELARRMEAARAAR